MELDEMPPLSPEDIVEVLDDMYTCSMVHVVCCVGAHSLSAYSCMSVRRMIAQQKRISCVHWSCCRLLIRWANDIECIAVLDV